MSEERRTGAHREKGLGWKPYWDERDHLMITHLQKDLAGATVPAEKVWQIGPILDQGREGACVGSAWRAWMNAKPIANKPERLIQVRDIYLQAQLVDEFPGQEPTVSGTSVRAAAKGPLVFSTRWFESMYEPDENGYVYPKGKVVGGHALCMFGVEENDDAHIQQSWGPDHGLEGCIKMNRKTLSYLVSQGYVSACAAAQIPRR